LGHGLPNAVGRAIARKNKNMSPIIVLIGDGEINEGTTWESALIASHLCLSNLLIIVDYNKMQSLGFTNNTLNLEPLKDKWIAFNFNVIEVDGHNHVELHNAFEIYSNSLIHKYKPTVIIANTIKGKGVSFMENNIKYHYSPIRDENDLEIAIKEIKNNA
jgi:transketolase